MKRVILFFLISLGCFGQVGIGTTSPDNTAMLDIVASDKGLLIPRVRLLDVTNTTNPINAPATGLMVWNRNNSVVGGSGEGFYYFNGTVWVPAITNTSNTLDEAYDFGGPGAGRQIIADSNPVHIGGVDGLLVTGTLGSGALLDTPLMDLYNSKMFFYPRKAAFRAGYDQPIDPDPLVDNAGAFNEDSDIGEYSFGAGKYIKASGEGSFGVGFDNLVSGRYASAFGSNNKATGDVSTALSYYGNAVGDYSFVTGVQNFANGDLTFVAGSNNIADAYGEAVFGIFNKNTYDDAHTPDANAINPLDRVFSVGNGSGMGNRKNAFEIFKSGKIRINDTYNLPLTDGTANQIIATDGAGNLSWTTPQNNKNIVSNTLYAENTAINFTNAVLTDVANVKTTLFPASVAPINGDVQIKLYVLCASTNVLTEFALIANDGVGTTTITPVSPSTTTIGSNVVYTSDWTNWNADETKFYNIQLQASGTNIDIANVYVLIRAQ